MHTNIAVHTHTPLICLVFNYFYGKVNPDNAITGYGGGVKVKFHAFLKSNR
jgi:hypothetical protein